MSEPTTPSTAPEPAKKRRREPIREATEAASGFAIVVGRRARWLVIGLWVLALGLTMGLDLPAKFAASETNEPRNYLPADAESTKAYEAINEIVKADNLPLVAVVRRDGGLTAADRAAITAQLKEFNALPPSATFTVKDADKGTKRTVTLEDAVRTPQGWLALGGLSKDGTSAIVLGSIKTTGDAERLLDSVDALREGIAPLKDEGLTVKVTGGAGFSYDAVKVFGDLNASLFLAAMLLVIVLLILIYRSPVLLFLPLIAVGFAELLSRGVGYLTTDLGVTLTGQSSAIMSILVLGAGTDYALLVVARYREELRHHENRHDALRLAMRSAGPAVFASGLTVAAGLLTLTVASVKGTAGLGPTGAIAVTVAMLAMLTLLPAMFSVLPRGVFWPRRPAYGAEGGDATHGAFRRIGERIAVRPRRTWVITSLALLLCVAGLSTFSTNLGQNNSFIGSVESVEGSELLAKSFPSGEGSPTQIVVPDAAKAKAVASAVAKVEGVAGAQVVATAPSGTLVDVTLEKDPFSTDARKDIPGIRDAAKQAGGDAVLVGGPTATEADLASANDRDLKVIIPLVLVVVFFILIALLRAVVLPLVLIGTVVLSFAATLGLSSVLWKEVFGFAGADRSIVIFAFVFLVALGIDYNIFLASRIREEALRYGTKEGILRGLGATGGVITAAGIVLAGTFVMLATTPVVFLIETGSAIALGVLLDTFIVRSILAPAMSLDLGDRIWWPWTTAKIPTAPDEAAAPDA